MPRYLKFEPKSEGVKNELQDYTLDNNSLLPSYFGNLAPINIFLGENNSGKSRFMREIMRQEIIRTVNLGITHQDFKRSLSEMLLAIENPELIQFGIISVLFYVNEGTADKLREKLLLEKYGSGRASNEI